LICSSSIELGFVNGSSLSPVCQLQFFNLATAVAGGGTVWRKLDLYASPQNAATVILSAEREESRVFSPVARHLGSLQLAEAGSE
jgi:hypothetical protein